MTAYGDCRRFFGQFIAPWPVRREASPVQVHAVAIHPQTDHMENKRLLPAPVDVQGHDGRDSRRKSGRARRYKVIFLGEPPVDLVDRVSRLHASAISGVISGVRQVVRGRPATRAPGRSGVRARSPDDSPDDLPDDVAKSKNRGGDRP